MFLAPWEFSPAAVALCVGAVVFYARGLLRSEAGERPAVGRSLAFFGGWLLIYFVMQTHVDYLSQHVFFVHRLQHLVLHHLGPFLIALSQPLAVLGRGLPRGVVRRVIVPLWRNPLTQFVYRMLQNAVVAPLLFVGLIYLWLTPSIHFDAMLSARYYAVMNWSMLLDGFLFWSLLLDPRTREEGARVSLGARIWMALLCIPPQILIGAYIAMSSRDLFDVYAVCGRAWAIAPRTDQLLGGIVTWIPASMMHGVAAVILIARWMRADARRAAVASCITA